MASPLEEEVTVGKGWSLVSDGHIRSSLIGDHEKERQMNNRKETVMRYKIALHQSDEGYSVSIPGFPGCWSEGRTEEEALVNIEAAIREYLSVVEDLLQDAEVREIELAV